jgi:hypothetical protein
MEKQGQVEGLGELQEGGQVLELCLGGGEMKAVEICLIISNKSGKKG